MGLPLPPSSNSQESKLNPIFGPLILHFFNSLYKLFFSSASKIRIFTKLCLSHLQNYYCVIEYILL